MAKQTVKCTPMINLKVMRVKKGLTQEELAQKCKISPTMLSQYELGKSSPRYGVLLSLAEALECEVKDII